MHRPTSLWQVILTIILVSLRKEKGLLYHSSKTVHLHWSRKWVVWCGKINLLSFITLKRPHSRTSAREHLGYVSAADSKFPQRLLLIHPHTDLIQAHTSLTTYYIHRKNTRHAGQQELPCTSTILFRSKLHEKWWCYFYGFVTNKKQGQIFKIYRSLCMFYHIKR